MRSEVIPKDSKSQNCLRLSSNGWVSGHGAPSMHKVCVSRKVWTGLHDGHLTGPDKTHPSFVWISTGPESPCLILLIMKLQYLSEPMSMSTCSQLGSQFLLMNRLQLPFVDSQQTLNIGLCQHCLASGSQLCVQSLTIRATLFPGI